MRKKETTLACSGDGGNKLWLAAQAATGGAIWTFAVYWAGVLMPGNGLSLCNPLQWSELSHSAHRVAHEKVIHAASQEPGATSGGMIRHGF